MLFNDDTADKLATRALGAFIGVTASMIMVAPESTKNAFYRGVVGLVMGFIFAPTASQVLWFLEGDTLEHVAARAAATGFGVWFILEGVARLLSSKTTVTGLLKEFLRIKESKK